MLTSTESIVLSSRKYGDSSKIVALYTRDHGKISVIAKGALRPRSKFGGALEVLTHSGATFYMKPGRDLHLLSSAEILTPMRKIQRSPEHFYYALAAIEAISQTQPQRAPNEELFDFILKILHLLNQKENNPYSIFVAFQMKLANLLGFNMDMEIDPADDPDPADSNYYFSIENGRISRSSGPGTFPLNADTALWLSDIASLPTENAGQIEFATRWKKPITNLFIRYFSFHLDKKFNYKTLDFFDFS